MIGEYDGLMEHCTSNAERRQLRRARRQLAALNTLLAARGADVLTLRLCSGFLGHKPHPDEAPIQPGDSPR